MREREHQEQEQGDKRHPHASESLCSRLRLAPWGAGRTGKKEDRIEAQCPQGALCELDFRLRIILNLIGSESLTLE